MSIPKDPYMLLSYVNTKLRDEFSSLDELCKSLCVDKQELIGTLEGIDCRYNQDKNAFV